jgi:hypothetical protein
MELEWIKMGIDSIADLPPVVAVLPEAGSGRAGE